jgi:hypothetical protein
MRRLAYLSALLAAIQLASPAWAAETVTYQYDSKGRLIKVVRTGGPNATATTDYSHDKADNRRNVKTTGAPR